MAKTQKGSPPKAVRQLPLDLSVDFVVMLDAFCSAHHGASRAGIIRDAVLALIETELAEDPGLRRRYKAAEQRLRKEQFTVVPPTPIKQRPKSD